MDNDKETRGLFAQFMDLLLRIGLGESMLRAGTTVLSIVMIGVVVWLVQAYYARPSQAGTTAEAAATEAVVGVVFRAAPFRGQ